MLGMSRDYQRSLVYEAEFELRSVLEFGGTIEHFGSTFNVPAEKKFGDIDSVQRYVDEVVTLSAVKALPRADIPVTVRSRRGIKKAHYECRERVIAIPDHVLADPGGSSWAMREVVVLHELAHHLDPDQGFHGPSFTATFLHLIEHVIDPVAAHMLRVALYERGVSIGTVTLLEGVQ